MIYSRHKEDAGRDRRVSSRACFSFFFSGWSAYLVSREEVVVENIFDPGT